MPICHLSYYTELIFWLLSYSNGRTLTTGAVLALKFQVAWLLGLFLSPTPQKFMSLWTALIVSGQFKVLVCIAEHITPVFQSHSEGAAGGNDFPQIILRAGANSCLFNSCNTNTVRCMPRSRTTTYGRSFSVSGPSLWNSLPLSVRDPSLTMMQFCTHLKTFCFAEHIVLSIEPS